MITDMRQRLNAFDPTSSLYTGVSAPGAGYDAKCIFSSYSARQTFTNNTTVAVELTIYDVYPRRDLTNSMLYEGAIINNVTQAWENWAGNPITCLGTYMRESTGVEAPFNYPPQNDTDMERIQWSAQRWGFNPMQSKLFRMYFKCRSRTICLGPGESHRHDVILKPNFLIDNLRSRYMNATPPGVQNMTAYAGLTSWTMIRVRGYKALSHDGKNHTTSAARIDIDSDRSRSGRIYRIVVGRTDNLSRRAFIQSRQVDGKPTSIYTQHVNDYRSTIMGDNFVSATSVPYTENEVDAEEEGEEGDKGVQFKTEAINPETEYLSPPHPAINMVTSVVDEIDEQQVVNQIPVGPQP